MPVLTAGDGAVLAHHSQGNDRGEPPLCLPGGPLRASAYLGDLAGLAEHRQLIRLDLPGTDASGISADPATYRRDRQVDDVETLRAHLGLERVDVLAHSATGDLATGTPSPRSSTGVGTARPKRTPPPRSRRPTKGPRSGTRPPTASRGWTTRTASPGPSPHSSPKPLTAHTAHRTPHTIKPQARTFTGTPPTPKRRSPVSHRTPPP
ncbi:alpha/beta fold hydrolase [Streptomyces sp. NPDC090442]|uniref:alpha/beta fold hydrolase n=1 Tax=Streptomyces sp. NPDC090442 TaxID=3365962 RepID=UPI0037F85BB4